MGMKLPAVALLLSLLFPLAPDASAAEPAYTGFPKLAKLARIVPKMNLAYAPAAEVPLVVHADAEGTLAQGVDAPLEDLEFRWDFGGAGEKLVNPVTGKPADLHREQTGPYAVGLYRRPGRYVVTLTVRGWTGSKYVTAKTSEVVTVGAWGGAVREFPPGDAQAVFDFLAGGDRRTAVLREGVYTLRDTARWHGGRSHRIVGVPGRTVLRAEGEKFAESQRMWEANAGGEGDIVDRVFQGVTFDADGKAFFPVFIYKSPEGGSVLRHLYFIDCSFAGGGQVCVQPMEAGSYAGFFNCVYDGGGRESASAFYVNSGPGFAFVGGAVKNVKVKNVLKDHCLYPNIRGKGVFRWASLEGDVGFGINLNGPADERGMAAYSGFVIDSNLFRTMHGIDLGNANNDIKAGRLEGVIIQNNRFELPEGRMQPGVGVSPIVCERPVIRFNHFARVAQEVYDYSGRNKALELKAYGNRGRE
jgi:hypothetical protein